jgi:hypothetical protein
MEQINNIIANDKYKLKTNANESLSHLKADVLERKNIRNPAAYFNTVATKEIAKHS